MSPLRLIKTFILTASLIVTGIPGGSVQAQGLGALVIRNDLGGRIDVRAQEIARLRAEGRAVELRGEACVSACTMYLGLDDVCVDPRTTFGFHGPSSYGIPMPPEYFEYWSEFLAGYYNAPLSDWFMKTARFELHSIYNISGKELIRLGYKPCEI
jgi:hypothetical protein